MKGDTYVVTARGQYWCIKNMRTAVIKRIGRISGRGVNYFDRAKAEAGRRMGISADLVRYAPEE